MPANRKTILAVAQAAITIVLLLALFRGFDWAAFRELYRRLPFWFYLGSLIVVFVGLVLYAWRWNVMLRAGRIRVPFRMVLKQYLIGVFVNNFLPSTIGGDAAKVFYLGRHHGYRAITASVILDRLLGIGLLSLVATAALWVEPLPHPRYLATRIFVTAIAAAFLAVVALAVVGTGGLPGHLERFGERAVTVAAHLQRFRGDLAAAVRSPAVWVQSALTVILYFVLLTVTYQVFISMQANLQPGFGLMLMAVASTSVLSNIPVAINGIGLREQLHVLLLEPLGVPKEIAVAISLLLFAHLLVASLAGGVLWWRTTHDRGGRL